MLLHDVNNTKRRGNEKNIFDNNNNGITKKGSKHADRDLIPYVVSNREAKSPDKHVYMLELLCCLYFVQYNIYENE